MPDPGKAPSFARNRVEGMEHVGAPGRLSRHRTVASDHREAMRPSRRNRRKAPGKVSAHHRVGPQHPDATCAIP